ncbi:YncE family protein, partial [Pseudomonas fluorescens]|uniref:YncE family protein n=1 Tax=Pseudomonas fluorescens TaxID=294 RepID=UPI003747F89F
PVNVTAQMDKEVTLPNTVVAFNLGKAVKVIYTVMRNGVPQDSKELSLSLLSIVDGDSRLSVPTIGGEAGNELDVTQLAESAQLTVAKWALQLLGQCIWLDYEGTDKNGDPVSKVFWVGEAHQQAEGLTTAAQVSWLRELKDAKPLVITFKVNFDKVPNADTAIAFPVKTYSIKAGPPPVLEFINAPYESITGEKLDPVIIRLTREELPEANATISLTLPPGFTYSDGSSGRRDFTTDAYGQISVTDIEVPDEEGEHLFQAASPGAIQTTAQVVILSPGPVGSIDLLGNQYSIAITRDGARVFADLPTLIAVIDTNTNKVVGHIQKSLPDNNWAKILVNSNNKKIYTPLPVAGIAIYDTETNKLIKTITNSTRYAIMSRDGTRLTYLDWNGPIRTIDTNTEQAIGLIPRLANTFPTSHNINGSIIYLVTHTTSNEFIFQARDVITAQQSAQYRFTHPAPQAALFGSFLSIDGEHIYLDIAYKENNGYWNKSLIVQLSSTTLQEQKRINVPDHSIIAQIFPDQIYLANSESTAIAVLEIKSGQIINHIEVGHRQGTRSANVSAVYTPDEKRLYVANPGGPLLAVVRTNR